MQIRLNGPVKNIQNFFFGFHSNVATHLIHTEQDYSADNKSNDWKNKTSQSWTSIQHQPMCLVSVRGNMTGPFVRWFKAIKQQLNLSLSWQVPVAEWNKVSLFFQFWNEFDLIEVSNFGPQGGAIDAATCFTQSDILIKVQICFVIFHFFLKFLSKIISEWIQMQIGRNQVVGSLVANGTSFE